MSGSLFIETQCTLRSHWAWHLKMASYNRTMWSEFYFYVPELNVLCLLLIVTYGSSDLNNTNCHGYLTSKIYFLTVCICWWCVGHRSEATVHETRHKGYARRTSRTISIHTWSLPNDVYKSAVDNSPIFGVQHGGGEQQVLSSKH